MNFLQRILKTKKVKKIKENFSEVDQKIGFSEKIEDLKDGTEEVLEKVADKIENKLDGKISYDKFLSVEVKLGEILEVEEVSGSDKLLKLKVNFGEEKLRQIISGIKNYFENPQDLVGKQCPFVTNLEPRKIFGLESDGMIFAVSDEENFSILEPSKKIKNGTRLE